MPATGDLTTPEGLNDIATTFKQEIIDNSKDNITEITDSMIAAFAEQATFEEGKIFAMYLYEEGAVDQTLRAVSVDPWLTSVFTFVSISDPGPGARQGAKTLPAIQGFFSNADIELGVDAGEYRMWRMEGKTQPGQTYEYVDLLERLLELVPARFEEYQIAVRGKTP
jgi:hypothetical protein